MESNGNGSSGARSCCEPKQPSMCTLGFHAHSICADCHVQLANGELTRALIVLGSNPSSVAQTLHAYRTGRREGMLALAQAGQRALENGAVLRHAPGDCLGVRSSVPTASPSVLSRAAATPASALPN